MSYALNLSFGISFHGSRLYAAAAFVKNICPVEISKHSFLPERSCSHSNVMVNHLLCHISSGKGKIVHVCN